MPADAPLDVHDRVRAFALGLPEAYEDFPWGDAVAKVAKKVFVFFGSGDDPSAAGMSVKLADSHGYAMSRAGTEPSGYGLGASGWVNVTFTRTDVDVDELLEWVEESYRLVAPKRLVKLLDAGASGGAE